MQTLAIVMRQAYGENVLSNAVFHRVKNNPADIVILDGIRWENDRSLLRSFTNNYLVYVTATPKIRYRRLIKRNQKYGEGETSFDQFTQEE